MIRIPGPRIIIGSAGIAQLVEHDLAKVGVASSSLVSRSRFSRTPVRRGLLFPGRATRFRLEGGLATAPRSVTGQVAEWSCSGLQIRVRRFDSDPGLHTCSGISGVDNCVPVLAWSRAWPVR